MYSDCTTPNRPVMLGLNDDKLLAVMFRPRCRSWSCPFCAVINRGLWAVRAYHGAISLLDQGDQVSFLTLTSHESLDMTRSREVFPHAWKNLSMRARRITGGFEYLLIPEQHQDGRLHIHAIETANLGNTWWKKKARACGLGYIAKEEKMRTPQGAAAYLVKYVTKQLEDLHWPEHFRRIRTSQDWPTLPTLEQLPGWRWKTLPGEQALDETYTRLIQLGYQVRLAGSQEAWIIIKEAE